MRNSCAGPAVPLHTSSAMRREGLPVRERDRLSLPVSALVHHVPNRGTPHREPPPVSTPERFSGRPQSRSPIAAFAGDPFVILHPTFGANKNRGCASTSNSMTARRRLPPTGVSMARTRWSFRAPGRMRPGTTRDRCRSIARRSPMSVAQPCARCFPSPDRSGGGKARMQFARNPA